MAEVEVKVTKRNTVDLAKTHQYVAEAKADPSQVAKRTKAKAVWTREKGVPRLTAEFRLVSGGTHTVEAELPAFFGSEGERPVPIQYLMYGSATCVGVGLLMLGALRGVDFEEVRVSAETTVNFSPVILDRPDISPLDELRLKVEVRTDADMEKVRELVDHIVATAPGVQAFARPIPVKTELIKLEG